MPLGQDVAPRVAQSGLETLCGKHIETASLTAPPAKLMGLFAIRAWENSDAAAYRDMLDDADLWRYMHEPYPGAISLDLAQSFLELAQQAGHHKVRAVVYRGQIIGQVRMQWHTEVTPPQSGEISYWLGRSHWGLGLAAPMIALFTWRCLSMFPALSVITARVHRDNAPSLRVLNRLGWTVTGTEGEWTLFELHRKDGIDWSRLRLSSAT